MRNIYVFGGASLGGPKASSTGRRGSGTTPLGEMAVPVHGRCKFGKKCDEFKSLWWGRALLVEE